MVKITLGSDNGVYHHNLAFLIVEFNFFSSITIVLHNALNYTKIGKGCIGVSR